jgi:16S rRNA (guanine527-N7)-methyltransferase
VEVLLKGIQRLGFDLGEDQVLQFQRYFQELAEWNTRINLTAIVDCKEVQAKHFLDSLTVSLVIPEDVRAKGTLMDVGSGAGFPGLPLKILWPGLRVTLVESVGKKAAFLRHMTDTLGLEGVEVHCQRAESLAHDPHMRETFDVVVSRAVADLSALAELTLPFCKLGGRVVAQKKSGIGDELKGSERAVSLLGGALERIEAVDLEEIGEPRWLVVLTKDASSPSCYPRRPGLPAKRPL